MTATKQKTLSERYGVTLDHAASRFLPRAVKAALRENGLDDRESRRITIEGEILLMNVKRPNTLTRTQGCLNEEILEETGALVARGMDLQGPSRRQWGHVKGCPRCLHVMVTAKQEHEEDMTKEHV